MYYVVNSRSSQLFDQLEDDQTINYLEFLYQAIIDLR
jgi:hypothetical protein